MISPLNKGAKQSGGAAPAQNQAIALRVAVIGAVLLVLFAIVFFRLWYLQILSGNSLAAAAAHNRSRTVAIVAPRGKITDRTGTKVFVNNRRAQILNLTPGTLPLLERSLAGEYGVELQKWHDKLVATYGDQRVAKWKKIPLRALARFPRPEITPLNDPKLVSEYAASSDPGALVKLRQRYNRLASVLNVSATALRGRVITSLYLAPYAAIPLTKRSAPDAVVGYVAENSELFPGVSTTLKTVRSYPYRKAAAQIFGQVGAVPVNETGPDKGLSTYTKYRKLDLDAQVGVSGLELQYDGYLRGKDGESRTSIDAQGSATGPPKVIAPVSGDNLQLTLDQPLQIEAAKQLAAGSAYNPGGLPGAVVAIDPRNGEILASQSNPSFDPNQFVRGVSQEDFQKFLNENGSKPLFNRVLDSGYAAGSTFKPATAFAGVATGTIGPETPFDDTGEIKLSDGTTRRNAGKAVNGPVALQRALMVSSDVYFYNLGIKLNLKAGGVANPIQVWARRLGYGHDTGVDLPGENPGLVPDPAWRQRLKVKEHKCRQKAGVKDGEAYTQLAVAAHCGYTDMRDWSQGDNIGLSIGQGDLQITPLQTAVMYAAIENGGDIVTPHFAKALQDHNGATRQIFTSPIKHHWDLAATGALDAIRGGLHDAASVEGGTSADVFKNWPQDRYPIFGKTGTAQKNGHADQSWYAAYVPDPVKPIVIVATVEEGGFGAHTAAPIVGEMLKEWYGLKDVPIVQGKGVDQ